MRNRENEFMGFLNNAFADVKHAEIFDTRPEDKNSAYEFCVLKKERISNLESFVYLVDVVKALENSNLKFFAEYYVNYGTYVRASLKIEGRKIEILIDTQFDED